MRFLILNRKIMQSLLVTLLIALLTGCGFYAQQIREKNREEYLLNNPGAYDPRIVKATRYVNHQFNLPERFRITHDWVRGFTPCSYHIIDLPKEKQNGYWYGSYSRLGDFFEYRGKTLQERRDEGYPHKTYNISSLDQDEYVKPHQGVDGKGNPKTYDPRSVCNQYLLGTSHSLSIWLIKETEAQWKKGLDRDFPDSKLMQEKIGENIWYGKRSELAPHLPNKIRAYERRVLPIADTGYVFEFEFGADQDSLKISGKHEQMKKIYRHLLESVKIERLSPVEEAAQRARIQALREAIDAHEANNNR